MILGPNRLGHAPRGWQRMELALVQHPKAIIQASPRMGKTDAVALCLRELPWERGLISAPLKVCPTWHAILGAAGIPTIDLSEQPAGKFDRLFHDNPRGLFVVNRDKLTDASNFAGKLDVFVADESHNYASPGAGRSRAYRKLAKATPWVRGLTGTLVPRHYGSLWSQLSPLAPAEWETSYEKFADHFLIRDAMFKSRVLSHKNVDELQRRMLRLIHTYRREDEWGPDQFNTLTRIIELPERARALYEKLAHDWVIDDAEFSVNAANAAVRLIRLQQLTSGFIPGKDLDGETRLLHQAKIDALVADLDEVFESDEKAVIFHRFSHEGRVAFDEIGRVYGHVPVFKLDGDPRVSASQHQRNIDTFNATQGAACYVVQIQSGSEGIKLETADHAMYLSRTFSFVDDEQSRDRIFLPQTPRTVTFYEASDSVDGFVADLLDNKRDIHNAVRQVDRESLVYGPIRKRKKRAA